MKTLLCLLVVLSCVNSSESDAQNLHKSIYPSYQSFSFALKKKIQNAGARVWVSTYVLKDKEVFRALLELKNRHHIDVRLLANTRNMFPPKSKDFYAGGVPKNVRIFDPPSSILIDEQLWFVDHHLDSNRETDTESSTKVKVIIAPDTVVKVYEMAFDRFTKDSETVRTYLSQKKLPTKSANHSNTYDYNRNSPKFVTPPKELPHTLPKVPLYEKQD